ncbi:kinase-like protein [Schizophyllum commune H4-8]|uniref:Aminoglycoside phosphotransferase domain-containing protein n=1 Tax=Schizophyllum commune (strain H4-8 / FGSC 9210) TaxID=578458 RepID=D8QH40_SCHCM|nr:kinase-like protein [Schizophyllum commune H4-8]KAI5887013.1 kinase-like protein [Schizophyllum commune H4-8]
MPCPGRANLVVFKQLTRRCSALPQLSLSSCRSTTFTATRSLPSPRRALSTAAESQRELFEYTSGRWVYNDVLQHKEREAIFDVDELCRLAAESVNQRATDVASISKLAEGGFNRVFLITLRDGQQVVARIPYPMIPPHYYAVASEVATIEYLRICGIPTPKVYGYSATSDNAAGTPYILMEFVQGTILSDIWRSLEDQDVISIIRQLTELEARMMSLSFPAGGGLYFTRDLEKVASGLGVPLDDERFSVGPDTKLALWYGRRNQLDVNRGPYHSAEETLARAAHKEIAYLKRFGQPRLPMRREMRPSYKFQPQSPLEHIAYLERYLSITSSLVPKDPALSRFCIRHPDLHPNNIFVERSPAGYKVVSLFDWQHASILPMFLLAGVPQRLQNYGDGVSLSTMSAPSRPDNADEMTSGQEYNFRRRLVHYHYVANTEKCNPLHYTAFNDPLYALRGRLFQFAGAPWEGESSDLKIALIEAMETWEELAGKGVSCPIQFDEEDLRKTEVLEKELGEACRGFELFQSFAGIGEEGWVPSDDQYEFARDLIKRFKEDALADCQSEEERNEVMNHWPWDDMDEDEYM